MEVKIDARNNRKMKEREKEVKIKVYGNTTINMKRKKMKDSS